MSDTETSLCSNCKRDIAVANYTMHTLHCHKNIVLCDICKDPVPRTQLQQHQDELHALVKCDICGLEMQISNLENHKEQLCEKRDVKCPICEIETPLDSYTDHLDYCETRTQLCPNCNQYVMQRDWNKHEESACQYPERPSPVTTSPTVGDDLLDMPVFPRDNSFVTSELRRLNANPMPFPYTSLLTASDSGGSMERDDTMLPCEFCNALLPPNLIIMHQSNCPRNPESLDDVEDESMERSEPSENVTGALRNLHFPRMNVADRGDLALTLDDEPVEAHGDLSLTLEGEAEQAVFDPSDEPMLPCEFCEEPVAMSKLVAHQAECPQDFLRSARGERTPITPPSPANKPVEPLQDFLRPISRRPAHHHHQHLDLEARPSGAQFRGGMWGQMDAVPAEVEPPRRNMRMGMRRQQRDAEGRAANRQTEQGRAAGAAKQTGNCRQQKPKP